MKRSNRVGSRWRRTVSFALAATCSAALVAACSSSGDGGKGNSVTITLEGPNQWTDSGSSFGPAWEDLVKAFEKTEPGIKVKTVAMPIKTFSQTISTQLSAGTAPELVFNQAVYQPYMVHHLDTELQQPNPYVEGNAKWMDVFEPTLFSKDVPAALDGEGHLNYIPLNVFATGLFYNKDAFAKAGVTAPVKTFAELMTACQKLDDAGYTPLAMDASDFAVVVFTHALADMLLDKYYDGLNEFTPAGEPGQSTQITKKDWVKAVLTKEISTSTPEVVEVLKLLKQLYGTCATKNWSGIASTSGAMTNPRDFVSGKAAMTLGTDYAPTLLGKADFGYAAMPLPTVTTESSSLAQGVAARYGASVGGTSYMIPSTTKGAKLKAAVKFLQFVSALRLGTYWPGAPAGVTLVGLYDGYLLGSKSLDEQKGYLQSMWKKWADLQVTTFKWQSEPWAK
jgi:ABC-type glycerol-3-phosphate transport system substrate-binding protein